MNYVPIQELHPLEDVVCMVYEGYTALMVYEGYKGWTVETV